jgi:hypothetical protein
MAKAIPLQKAHNEVAEIFSVIDVSDNGKLDIRCSRCEGLTEKERGKSFQLVFGAITKDKEHIAIYCPEIRPLVNIGDANLHHTLLINMTAKHVSSMSKHAQALRKLFAIKHVLPLCNLCLYCLD